MAGYNLIVSVSVATEEILEDWWRHALLIGGTSLGVGLALVILALMFQIQADRLEKARTALADVASKDGLTGLANRREFDVITNREWDRALRERTPLSVLMIDADLFKQVNDRFGHAEGDRVLKELAVRIQSNLRRATDIVARYGGEEFAVVLPNTDCAGAMRVAEVIRIAVAEGWGDSGARSSEPQVTVSIGAASAVPDFANSRDQLVAAADGALYMAKQAGRNTSRLAEQTIQQTPVLVSLPRRA